MDKTSASDTEVKTTEIQGTNPIDVSRSVGMQQEQNNYYTWTEEDSLLITMIGCKISLVPGKIDYSRSFAGGDKHIPNEDKKKFHYRCIETLCTEKDNVTTTKFKNTEIMMKTPNTSAATTNRRRGFLSSAAEIRIEDKLIISGGDDDAPPVGCFCWPLVHLIYRIRYRLFSKKKEKSPQTAV